MTIMNSTYQRGLTLIELMVALVISLLILAGLFTVYQSNQRGNRLNDGLVRTQESGRFAIDFLSRDLRQAGYPNADPNSAAFVPDPFHLFLFFGGADNIDVVGTNPGQFTPTDVLSLRHGMLGALSTDCSGNSPGNVDPVQRVENAITWNPDGNTSWNRYDIQATGRLNNRGNPIFALYCNNIELVEGIENMQVLYGMDTTPTPDFIADQYVSFTDIPDIDNDNVRDWGRIISIRIALLASSVDERANAPSLRTFTLLDTVIPAFNDQKMRRIYTTTVLIRNNITM